MKHWRMLNDYSDEDTDDRQVSHDAYAHVEYWIIRVYYWRPPT